MTSKWQDVKRSNESLDRADRVAARVNAELLADRPSGDGKVQYCPQCGLEKVTGKQLASFCRGCGKRVTWVGPLWGEL